jgi:hypothetical protein
MAQRSPYNDRYKIDQKGKTRKSASAAKPKRAIADVTPADSAKKTQKKSSFWSRAKSTSGSGSPSTGARAVVSTPRMKQMRRIWWVLWVTALAVAVGILLLQQAGMKDSPLITVAWAIWLAAMGGAFYLEFFPIRKERAAAIELAKHGGKPAKNEKTDKNEKPAKGAKADKPGSPAAPAPDDRLPPSPEDPE